ncbi:MAG: ATP synthase F1 subunit delta [Chitinophagaceae bacterium]|jgi:F-type H+-transporting ATPase subunit delta|nr:ATP synthase F1 subunit delta [Chitinophagaceae bacterium]MBK7678514.1 ATP synthase F1 subunit delta [Chitinophagaceae bacterium]MBK8300134.1 ATP synthase F1 subunit delta [Chitinophagaceae bacterium]MBK9464178.1 ATP synthase F1 subunit delta [Chitinophagaceae bacterium]MBK9658700.1 ATP synthase F1 subunit delta [Chitinophagaceae bacterium]
MPNPRLATRYAKSLIDLAIERGELESVYADMQWLRDVCKSNRDFVNLLRSPIIKGDTKKKILEAITGGNISEITAGFNRLLITKGRESNLPEISNAFVTAYKVKKNIQTIKLTTAAPVSDTLRNAVIEQVKKSIGFENVELEEKVDPEIIGGFILQAGDKLVEASVSYDLKTIAKQFENNDFIYNVR